MTPHRFATLTVAVERPPSVNATTGLRGSPTSLHEAVKITEIYPVDPEYAERMRLDSPIETLEAYAFDSLDIMEGDIIIPTSGQYSGKRLEVKAVGDWPWRKGYTRHILIEEIKAS